MKWVVPLSVAMLCNAMLYYVEVVVIDCQHSFILMKDR